MSEQRAMNIKTFAEHCGLSVGTVSGIINKRPGFSPHTVALVQQKMREHNYHPNPYAQRMQHKQTGVIGVCCRVDQTMFHAYILKELIYFFQGQGCNTMVHYLQAEEDFDMTVMAADAYLLMGKFPHLVEQIQRYQLQALVLDQGDFQAPKMHHLQFDRIQAHSMLVDYLVQRGHEYFAYIGKKSNKYQQYAAAINKRQKTLACYAPQADPDLVGDFFKQLAKSSRHMAFFIPYEGHVLQFALQCQMHELQLGRDVSAVTWGMPYSELLPQADFTRIGVFTDAIGQRIMAKLRKKPPARAVSSKLPLAFHHGTSVRDFRES